MWSDNLVGRAAMRCRRSRRVCWIASAVGLLSLAAEAGAAPSFGIPPDPSAVYGGHPVAACGWPTAVSIEGRCSGTLIHPEVVVYAAHCGDGFRSVHLGEHASVPARSVATEFCAVYPGGDLGNGRDVAVCKLAEPILDVPIVPPLMGCEAEILTPGREVVLVGFGMTDAGTYGDKHEVTAPLQRVTNADEAHIGGDGVDTCRGDSGGPAFVQLPEAEGGDGTWRVFGITSYGGTCGGGGYYSMMHVAMPWIESTAGVDVTPCHDADGTWAPGPACREFPRAPGGAGGGWPTGCDAGLVGGFSSTCGEAFDASVDHVPPVVRVTEPQGRARVIAIDDEAGEAVEIVVDADDGDGTGVARAELWHDGARVPGNGLVRPPWAWSPTLTPGTHLLVVRAEDALGNASESEPIEITVEVVDAGCAVDRRGGEGALWMMPMLVGRMRRSRASTRGRRQPTRTTSLPCTPRWKCRNASGTSSSA